MKDKRVYKLSYLIVIAILLIIVGILLGLSILRDSSKNTYNTNAYIISNNFKY